MKYKLILLAISMLLSCASSKAQVESKFIGKWDDAKNPPLVLTITQDKIKLESYGAIDGTKSKKKSKSKKDDGLFFNSGYKVIQTSGNVTIIEVIDPRKTGMKYLRMNYVAENEMMVEEFIEKPKCEPGEEYVGTRYYK
jgi:hypothetical protein